jgi:general secretion pathway protein D
VPGLGNVPLFGNLFKSEARRRNKTNLMVFLRPVVVRDGAATEALSRGRYEQMRINQQGFQPEATSTLPISGSAVLPALSPESQPATPPSAPPASRP